MQLTIKDNRDNPVLDKITAQTDNKFIIRFKVVRREMNHGLLLDECSASNRYLKR